MKVKLHLTNFAALMKCESCAVTLNDVHALFISMHASSQPDG